MKDKIVIKKCLYFLGLFALISMSACSEEQKSVAENSGYEKPTVPYVPYDTTNFSTSENPFVCGTEGYDCYRIPTLAVTKNGTILAFMEGRRNNCDDAGDIDIVLKRSTDRGKTWSKIITVKDDGINRCQNQCPVVLSSGRILLITCWNPGATGTRSVFVTYSDDEGLTWAKEKNITPIVKLSGWGWYATGPCHGIVKQQEPNKGRVIVSSNHSENGKNYSHVIYSDDNGATWALGGTVGYENGNESTVAELSNGDIMINMRNSDTNPNHFRMVSISKDGGKTFGDYYPDYALIEPGSGSQGVLLRHSINPVTGKANILFSNPNHGTSRRDGTIKLSENDGLTWTKSYKYADNIDDNNWYTGYSDLALMDNGDVAVLYEKGYKYSRGIWFKIIPFSEIK
ncbi:MAG: sialidase family protein [Bacteroidales bacterium]|nr:sialidase family protein [Bacteroidales bacterium]MDD3906590.1 sialidase family protein [Bacteroidales bacterium]MDD4711819.1 sialidase family protein [Bacteroidales bacterium]MEA4839565.1 sialidase family protein [Bacteroidales bacterium]